MAISIIQTTRFRVAFAVWWGLWSMLQAAVINAAGFSWADALVDSGINNLMLAGTSFLLTIKLHYYTPQKNLYGYLFFMCSALCLLWLFLARSFCLHLIDSPGYDQFYATTIVLRGAIGLLVLNCFALVSLLWNTLQDQQETEKRRSEAESLLKEAELNTLRQQLQPHFLFNSLNSINALIGMQPQKARSMVQQLSEFLRGTLKKDQKEWIPLEEELAHLQLYLEIEKVRFGHRLNAVVHNETAGAQLPLMLLQPVVENAIKFGLYDTTGDITISIAAVREDGYLVLEVKNPYDPETTVPQKGTGFGLRSVQRRLSLLFARPDLLQTKTNDNIFTTTIKIPQP